MSLVLLPREKRLSSTSWIGSFWRAGAGANEERPPFLQRIVQTISKRLLGVRRPFSKAGVGIAAGLALALSGCIQSPVSLITDAKPLAGELFEAHFYQNFVEGKAEDVHKAVYHWKNGRYMRVGGPANGVRSFAAIPLNGTDFVIEGKGDSEGNYAYWMARKIVDGVFLIVPINEDDADEITRANACTPSSLSGFCVVKGKEELMSVAKAVASKPMRNPTLGVLILRKEGV